MGGISIEIDNLDIIIPTTRQNSLKNMTVLHVEINIILIENTEIWKTLRGLEITIRIRRDIQTKNK